MITITITTETATNGDIVINVRGLDAGTDRWATRSTQLHDHPGPIGDERISRERLHLIGLVIDDITRNDHD